MKKTKKAGPKAFGVRLEDCQPGVINKVSPDMTSAIPECGESAAAPAELCPCFPLSSSR